MTIVPTRAMQLIERALTDPRRRDSDRRPRQRRAGQEPAGDDLFAAGRRPVSQVARRLPAARTTPRKIELTVGPFYSGGPPGGDRHQRREPRRRFHLRRGQGGAGRPRRPKWASRTSSCPSPTTGRRLSITLDPRYLSDFLRVLDPEKTFTLELRDAESAAVCSTDDGYAYVIMPLARDQKAVS